MNELKKEFEELRDTLTINLSFLGDASPVDENSYWIVDDFYGEKIQYIYLSKSFNNRIKDILSEVVFSTRNHKDWKIIIEFYEESEIKVRGISVEKSKVNIYFDENK